MLSSRISEMNILEFHISLNFSHILSLLRPEVDFWDPIEQRQEVRSRCLGFGDIRSEREELQ